MQTELWKFPVLYHCVTYCELVKSKQVSLIQFYPQNGFFPIPPFFLLAEVVQGTGVSNIMLTCASKLTINLMLFINWDIYRRSGFLTKIFTLWQNVGSL